MTESSTPGSPAPVSSPGSSSTPSAPSGVLDTVYALAAASARTAVELTLRGPQIVRGLASAAHTATVELSPLVVDALRAVPRVAVVLESLLPLAQDLQRSLDALAAAAPDLHALAEAVPALQQLGGAAEDIRALTAAVPALQQLGGAAGDIRELTGAVESLGRLASAVDDLDRIAAATSDVRTIAGAVPTAQAIAEAVPLIEALAEAVPEVEKLTGAIEHVEVLARHADTTFPDMPPRLESLDRQLSVAAAELTKVTPDLRTVAGRIEELDGQIKVLAHALAPLQGTTERLGRLVDRLPQGRTRRAVEG
ncbi:MAG TPA: hypothetical protein VGH76_23395 [Actinomycetospora sp.]|uniref:hypothetical protein n=1 Tax=Actinomycetospora sp. TaxID=1872135 RepID=UPI002F3E3433